MVKVNNIFNIEYQYVQKRQLVSGVLQVVTLFQSSGDI